MDWYPLYNSLRIAAISTVLIFLQGFLPPTMWPSPRPSQGVLDVCSPLPLVLPPWWAISLLRILGPKRVVVGLWFLNTFDIKLTMVWYSAVFASAVVAFPMYRTAGGLRVL